MVVKPDGSKWSCTSCLKGHRVSSCTHTDRELTLVPKKGRPVTQCHHCRSERKKRSAHVKCDCGEVEKVHHPKEKCIHLREAEERAKAGFHEENYIKQEEDPAHLVAVAEEQGCCCHHGGKCSCSLLKKEPQNKSTGSPHGPAVPKPRLESTKSDGSITVFANGHHKPVHRKNYAAHEGGMPYKMPMARSHVDQHVTRTARRSVDSLPLNINTNMLLKSSSYSSQMSTPVPTERRLSRSEQPSPNLGGVETRNSGLSDPRLSAIDFSNLGPIRTNQSSHSATSDSIPFPAFDPMAGIADGSYDPWSAFPSTESIPNNNPFGAWPTTFDASSVAQPALTAASSGSQSEIDEIPAMEELYGLPMPSIQEDAGFSNADATFSQGNGANRRSLPPGFFGNAGFNLPNVADDWQTTLENSSGLDEGKMRANGAEQSLATSNVWLTPTMPAMTGIAQRSVAVTATSTSGRPHSQSLGPSSAPNEDLIRQLFPDIDLNNGMGMGIFGAETSPALLESSHVRRLGRFPLATSSAMDSSSVDHNMGFKSQPWSDGSISVPNDAFTTSYNLEHDFSSSSYNGAWPFQ